MPCWEVPVYQKLLSVKILLVNDAWLEPDHWHARIACTNWRKTFHCFWRDIKMMMMLSIMHILTFLIEVSRAVVLCAMNFSSCFRSKHVYSRKNDITTKHSFANEMRFGSHNPITRTKEQYYSDTIGSIIRDNFNVIETKCMTNFTSKCRNLPDNI